MIMEDIKSYPVNYNHYYTDTIRKRRQAREKNALAKCLAAATQENRYENDEVMGMRTELDIEQVVEDYMENSNSDMEKHSCEDALDCLFSIYKVTFTPNHPGLIR